MSWLTKLLGQNPVPPGVLFALVGHRLDYVVQDVHDGAAVDTRHVIAVHGEASLRVSHPLFVLK